MKTEPVVPNWMSSGGLHKHVICYLFIGLITVYFSQSSNSLPPPPTDLAVLHFGV